MIKDKTGQVVGFNDVMNSIRASASTDYQDRIPALNDDNFREFATGMSIPKFFNEWHDALINRIGLTVLVRQAWNNPLKFLMRGTLEFGEAVEEIYVALIDAQKWEPETTEADAGLIFKTEKPDVYAAFHKINRTDMYPASYSRTQVRKAFLNAKSLENFVLQIWEALHTSAELDEYLYMKQLIAVNDEQGLFHYVQADPTDLNELIVQVRTLANNYTFMSKKYNAMGVDQHAPKDNQVILISSELDAKIDVNVLASAFNIGKAEFLSRRIVLDDLGVDGALLALVSRDWYMVYDVLREMREMPNPRSLEIKYYYHVHQIISTSRFQNATLFVSTPVKTPDKVEIKNAVDNTLTIGEGQSELLEVEVTAGGSTDDVKQAVLYQMAGALPDTKIINNRLFVAIGQTDFKIKVIALHDHSVTETIDVTIGAAGTMGRGLNVDEQTLLELDTLRKENEELKTLQEKENKPSGKKE